MSLKRLKIFPFSVFLLPLFFLWHVCNAYFGLIPFKYSSRFLLYYFILAGLLFLLGKLIFRNNTKAGCWSTLLLLIFFFWGAVHDFLRSFHLPAFLTSYKFLFTLIAAGIILFTIFLRKKNPPFKVQQFLNILFGIFVLAEAVMSIAKMAGRQSVKNDLSYNSPLSITPGAGTQPKPDIFLLVFDEYASTPALRQYTGYDNSGLDSTFSKAGFYVAGHSKSNYNSTPLSIASFLDMDYFDQPLEGAITKSLLVLQGQYTIRKSRVPAFLAAAGYEIINLGLCDLEHHPAATESFFNNNAIEVLYLETMWGRIEREIWWNVQQKTSLNWTFLQSSRRVNMPETNFNNLQRTITELNTQGHAPKLVVAHIMMPHKPFFFDREGHQRANAYTNDPAIDDSLYIDQLIYTNSWLDLLAKAAPKQFKRPRVVLIAGDHGYRDKENNGIRDKQFMNLNAWYFSDRDYSQLYDSISPVNSFRVILNKYFATQLPLLKDSTIRLIE